MRRLLGFGTLLLSTAALAQSSASGVVALTSPPSQGCPVGFFARHAMGGGLIGVDRSSKSLEHAYNVSFQPDGAKLIAQAKITLRGLAGPQVIPAGDTSKADARETFTVAPAAQSHHLYGTMVYAEKITGVQWIELNEVTFKDGTRWRESDTARCGVAPNGFMLVASRASQGR